MSISRLSLVVLAFAALAFGQPVDSVLGRSFLSIGLNEYYYSYSEDWSQQYLTSVGIPYYIGSTPHSNETGATTQLHIEGRGYLAQTSLYGGFLFNYGSGQHLYDGGIQSDTVLPPKDTVPLYTAASFTKTNTFLTIGAFIGPYFARGSMLWSLHAGFLYYYWDRDLNGMTEDYSWLYLPLGGEVQFDLGDGMSIGLGAEYRVMLSGNMTIGVPSADYVNAAPTLTLSPEEGFYAEAPFRFSFSPELFGELKPWFEYRPSGSSNTGYLDYVYQGTDYAHNVTEPSSTSWSVGVVASLMFAGIGQSIGLR